MKITPPTENSVAISSNTASLAAKVGPAASVLASADAATKSTQSPGVAVTVSTLARSLKADKSAEVANVDAAKVKAVRAAIAQGTYQVNPEVIADKLLSNAEEFLQHSRA